MLSPADERLLRILDARDTPRWLIGRLLGVSPERAAELLERVRVGPSRGRVRRSELVARAIPPDVLVLAVDPDTLDAEVLGPLVDAAVPGWSFRIDDSDDVVDDAIASARHRAMLRGEDLVVVDRRRVVVAVSRGGVGTRRFRLVVVRRSGPS